MTRAAVAESAGGSGFERLASRCRCKYQSISKNKCIERTYISCLTPSERFVAAAVAWETFLFKRPLGEDVTFPAFRVAATRLADIRKAIRKIEKIYYAMGWDQGRNVSRNYYASLSTQS